ncbi:hypothetical protein QJS63_06465 [Pseudomonas juntendi]|nr:hypothetical protein QJS63_06465 [Pseudomonas juntendi]
MAPALPPVGHLEDLPYLTPQARKRLLFAGLRQAQQARGFELLGNTAKQQAMAVQHAGYQ